MLPLFSSWEVKPSHRPVILPRRGLSFFRMNIYVPKMFVMSSCCRRGVNPINYYQIIRWVFYLDLVLCQKAKVVFWSYMVTPGNGICISGLAVSREARRVQFS
jgi:hypothetical protein